MEGRIRFGGSAIERNERFKNKCYICVYIVKYPDSDVNGIYSLEMPTTYNSVKFRDHCLLGVLAKPESVT